MAGPLVQTPQGALPAWVVRGCAAGAVNKDFICAVGKATTPRNSAVRRTKADLAAKLALMRTLATRLTPYFGGGGGAGATDGKYDNQGAAPEPLANEAVRKLAASTLNRLRTEDLFRAADGSYYVHLRLSLRWFLVYVKRGDLPADTRARLMAEAPTLFAQVDPAVEGPGAALSPEQATPGATGGGGSPSAPPSGGGSATFDKGD